MYPKQLLTSEKTCVEDKLVSTLLSCHLHFEFTSEKICIRKIRMAGVTCSHCGRWYCHEKNLKRHVRSSHTSQPPSSCGPCGKSFSRADNLQKHMRNCTGHGVATTVAAATTVPAPAVDPSSRLQFKLQKTHKAL